MSEEEKDILVSKRKYWTKIMKYNLVGTIFLVILFFLMAITIDDSCNGMISEMGIGCVLFNILILFYYLFLCISWPLSFIMYGYQSFKIYNQSFKIYKLNIENKGIVTKKNKAMEREEALDYNSAIKIWEELGEINEAARVRKLKTEEGAVKVTQKVVHGDEVTKTEIKDSVLNRSNVGGGSSKAEELREAKSLFEEGLINEDDYENMKKEILGK